MGQLASAPSPGPGSRSPGRLRSALLALALGGLLAGLALALAEASLAWLHPDAFEVVQRRAAARGEPLDRRSRMTFVRSLRATGVDAVPRIVPAALLEPDGSGPLHSRIRIGGEEVLPLAGIAGVTTVLCAEGGPYAVYESDAQGFRNPPGAGAGAPIELLLLGDSFTIGECVPEGQTIADRLRERWPATVNLGYSGNSPLLELATLVEYGRALRPRRVLWLYFENDLSQFDIERSARSPLLARYLEPGFSQGLRERRAEIDAALRSLVDERIGQPDDPSPVERFEAVRPGRWERLRSALRLSRTRRWLAGRFELGTATDRTGALALFDRVLDRARDEVADFEGELVFVFLPGSWNYDSSGGVPHWAGGRLRRAVLERVAARGIPIIDLHAALAGHRDPLALYAYPGQTALGPSHFNAAGYAFAADSIRAALEASSTGTARRSQISRQ